MLQNKKPQKLKKWGPISQQCPRWMDAQAGNNTVLMVSGCGWHSLLAPLQFCCLTQVVSRAWDRSGPGMELVGREAGKQPISFLRICPEKHCLSQVAPSAGEVAQ